MSLTIVSRDFGAWTNGIRLSFARDAASDAALPIFRANSGDPATYTPGTFKVEYPALNQSFSYRIRNGILLTDGSSLTVDFSTSEFRITTPTITDASIDMALVPTLRDLAAWINRHAGISAEVVGPSYFPSVILNTGEHPTQGSGSTFIPAEEGLLAYLLWAQCPLVQPAPLPPTTPPVLVDGALPVSLPTILAWDEFAVSAIFGTVYPTSLPDTLATPLSGGAGSRWDDISTDTAGLNQALLLAGSTECAYVWVQSVAQNVQNLVKAHCEEMSTEIRQKYRIFIAGVNFTPTSPSAGAYLPAPDMDTAVSGATKRAPELNGPVVLCFNGTVFPNAITGQPEQLGGLGLASQILGMASGARPGQPLTNKVITSQGLEFPVVSDSQVDALLEAGVLSPSYSPEDGVTTVIQALTCFQTSDPSFRLLHGLRIQHTVCRLWLKVLSPYKGKPLDLEDGERIKLDCAKALDNSILSGSNPDGFLTRGRVNGKDTPAWDGLQVTGDTSTGLWDISVNAHPVGETDYIRVRTKFLPTIIQL